MVDTGPYALECYCGWRGRELGSVPDDRRTTGICDDCVRRFFPEVADELLQEGKRE